MSQSAHRTIIEEQSFATAFAELKISHQRLDEVLVGLHQALSQKPELSPRIPGTVLSIIKTKEFPDTPALRIFFTYTDAEVHLRHVEVIEQGGETDDPDDPARPVPE